MIKIQAHRGFSENYPENTMLAFQKAYETGASGIEVDIFRTLDGEFVIIHDETVDRTTNGTGRVDELTWSYISSLDAGSWFSSNFAGRDDCKVPSLNQFLDSYKGLDVDLIIQIKFDNPTDIHDFIDVIVSKGMIEQVHVFGWYTRINEAKAYNQNIFTQNDNGPFTMDNFNMILDNAIQHNHDSVSINAINSLTDMTYMVSQIKVAGKYAHVSFLSGNYQAGIDKAIQAGADFILGDNPQIMQSYVDSLNGISRNLYKTSDYLQIEGGKILLDKFIKKDDGLHFVKSYVSFVNT